MPPGEHRALVLLLVLAVAGQGVRHLLTRPGEPPGGVQLLATISPSSPSAQRDSAMQQTRPLAPDERIDVDRASVAELARLPRVGPRLAKVMHADRGSNGAFGSLAGLDRVPGVGPGLLKLLEPHVRFSGSAEQRGSGAAELPHPEADCPPVISAALPIHPQADACPAAPLKLNTATLTELDALPGVGPAKAAAILRYREQHGPFASVDQLARVPGLGPAAVTRLRARLAIHRLD